MKRKWEKRKAPTMILSNKELKRTWKGIGKELKRKWKKNSFYHDSHQQGIEKDLKRNWKGIEKEMGKETFLPWLPPTTPHPVPVSCACLKRKLQRSVSTMIATNITTSSTVGGRINQTLNIYQPPYPHISMLKTLCKRLAWVDELNQPPQSWILMRWM